MGLSSAETVVIPGQSVRRGRPRFAGAADRVAADGAARSAAPSTGSNRIVIASAASFLSTVSSSGKQKNGENPAMGKLTTVSFPMAFEACQFSKYRPT
jgi:hypothetical protein